MRSTILAVAALLVLAAPVGSHGTGAPGMLYRRASQPQFNSKTIRGRQTRLVFEKLDIKNNTFTALVVRDREVLCGLAFTFTAPPETLRPGQTFELPVSARPHAAGLEGASRLRIGVQLELTPNDHFTVSGFPLIENSADFDLARLRSAAPPSDPSAPLTQKLQVTLEEGDAKSVVLEYIVRLEWDTDLHEVRVRYPCRRREGWWSKARPDGPGVQDASGGAEPAEGVTIPSKPWKEPGLAPYFSEYMANLNGSVRSQRGSAWSVDAWGREVGPATTLTLKPEGSWQSPSHYLWARNPPYEFYPLTIRDYIRARMEGRSVDDLLEGSRPAP